MIQWQWVIAAFLIGVTLTLCLEIRRRGQAGKTVRIIYILPIVSCLLAVGVWLTGYESAASSGETAVIILPAFPQPTPTTQARVLPAPQISLKKAPIAREIASSPTSEPLQTAVTHLRIPSLNLNKPVHAIPLENGTWNVAELGSDVGWLETTAVSPDEDLAMVFVGHMTFANENLLEQGAFADIPTLPYDTPIILETESGSYTYFIDSVRRVSPDNAEVLYQEPGNSILLLTCADWNPQQGVYENRLLVRASKNSEQ